MQKYREESEIHDYKLIQLSNNVFINGVLKGNA